MKNDKADDKTTIQVSEELRQRIKIVAAHKNSTYEQILDELISSEMSKLNLDRAVKNKSSGKRK